VVVVGSGYGGAVAAARLSGVRRPTDQGDQPLSVCVLERGREYLPGEFPERFADLPGHVRINRFDTAELTGDAAGLFDVRIGADVSVLLGNGLGGGSLINAGVAEVPDAAIFNAWPVASLKDRDAALGGYFKTAATMLGVGPAVTAGLRKYREFASLAEGLGLQPRPANIAVSFEDKADNGHGVAQAKCINCGDCFTGCNYHAKNTLPMNYLARAERNGASLYSGVTVSHLERVDDQHWAVCFFLTPRPGTAGRRKETYRVLARHVVLAAGALGSTEILMRSEKKGALQLSGALGRGFSCNGDMIGSLYDQDCYVNAAAREGSRPADRNVGPTITGIATGPHPFVIEELAIPSALRRVFEEVVTTAALPYALSGFEPAISLKKRPDPLAVDPQAVDRSQVLAAMGLDSAAGVLHMIPGSDDAANRKVADGVVTVHWVNAGKDCIYEKQDEFLARPTSNGGEYLRSPLWQPLPPEMSSELGGKKPEGKVFTVHPLGGCPMADDPALGVVNDIGQVYCAGLGKHGVHKNLQVLDGSIIPGALGINPLLTITALAERAIDRLIMHHPEWSRTPASAVPRAVRRDVPCDSRVVQVLRRTGRRLGAYAGADRFAGARFARSAQQAGERTALRFAERVHGTLDLGGTHNVELTLHFQSVGENGDDIPAFLRDGKRELRIESGTLRAWPKRGQGHEQEKDQVKHAPEAAISGGVVLLEHCRLSAFRRTYTALSAFLRRRGIADWLQKRREQRAGKGLPEHNPWDERWGRLVQKATPLIAILAGVGAEIGCLLWPLWLVLRRLSPSLTRAIVEGIRGTKILPFVVLAYQTGEARRLIYRLRLESDLPLASGVLPKGTRIEGEKILRYTRHGNPWWQLFGLPLAVYRPGSGQPTKGVLTVDLGYFFRRYATQLQITRQANLPLGLVDLFSTVLFLLRLVAKVHFWSFRLPEYQKHDPGLIRHRTPGPLPGLRCEQVMVEAKGADPELLLTHYWKEANGDRGLPVVLFHGLGASGNQFATSKLDVNLVQHLAELNGRDVWVAEMRHSIARKTSLEQWKLDTIALGDVGRIVRKVLERTGERKVDVVAHCIGSAMFCTAALHGDLAYPPRPDDQKIESMINAAVLMQVGPLITLSEGTKIRAYLAAFLRRYMREAVVDFSVDDSADWIDSLIDRVLATYPYPKEEEHHHEVKLPWESPNARESNLHLANCNRWAAIDGRMLEHDNLDRRMLSSLGEILGHANLTTWEQTIQYAYLERLTDHEACNTYVTDERIRKYFKFPVRFIHGEKNDVFSVETSRRSCELLKEVHGTDFPCDLVTLPKYSHLDPLIGKSAHTEVYPRISAFLGGPSSLMPFTIRERSMVRLPLIGPVLGWTRKETPGGPWIARLWCRIDDSSAPCSYVVIVPRKGADRVIMPRLIKLKAPIAGRIDTLAAVDVELAAADDRYEIEVISVHLPKYREPQVVEAIEAKEQGSLKGATAVALARLMRAEPVAFEEVQEQIAESQKLLMRNPDDGCTTDPDYDGPLGRALLRPGVLAQNSAVRELRFAFASCRYGASVVDRERADALFGRLRTLVESDDPKQTPGLLLLVGDQIYADQTAGLFDAGNRRQRFYEAYREAWTAPNARAVLSQLPTYMMMDDHEVGDDWHPDDKLGSNQRSLREHGLVAFQEYQLLHSPRPEGQRGFWYQFESGDFPFFVLDTRSGRDGAGHIINADQLTALKHWLQRQDRDAPKFVVSPSVVVPFHIGSGPEQAYAARSDAWDGYPESLRQVLQLIHGVDGDPGYDNVVFLCGDAHLSMASRIWFTDAHGNRRGPRAYCAVSSGLYAPFPFANSRPRDYLPENYRQGRARRFALGNGVFMHYEVEPNSWLEEDSFSLVEVRQADGRWRIDLRLVAAQTARAPIELTYDMQRDHDAELAPVGL
jgi:cholesterol oxidase